MAALNAPKAAGALAGLAGREVREVIREEPVMRPSILAALADGPLTIPEIAEAIGAPSHEVVFWIMGMRRYGWVAEIKGSADDGYFRYEATGRTS